MERATDRRQQNPGAYTRPFRQSSSARTRGTSTGNNSKEIRSKKRQKRNFTSRPLWILPDGGTKLKQEFRGFSMRFLSIWLTITGVTGTIVTFASYSRLPSDVFRLIYAQSSDGIQLTAGQYTIQPYVFATGLVIFILCLAFLATNAIDQIRGNSKNFQSLRRELATTLKSRRHTEKVLASMREDVARLAHQSGMASTQVRSLHSIKRIHYKFNVLPKYNGQVNARFVIEATEAMMFWDFWIESDDNAIKVQTMDDISAKFEILESSTPLDIVTFPILVRANRVGVLVGFIPPLQQGSSIELGVNYTWPGFFNTLKLHKKDRVYWAAQTATPHQLVDSTIEISSSKSLPKIKCKNDGNRIPGETLAYNAKTKTWTYKASTNFSNKQVNLSLEIL